MVIGSSGRACKDYNFIQGLQMNSFEVGVTDNQFTIYEASRLDFHRYMWSHKFYNWSDMDVYLGLDNELNTIDHEIESTVTVRNFKNYTKEYEEELTKSDDEVNKKSLHEK